MNFGLSKATCNTWKVGASILLQILTPSVGIQMDHPFLARRAFSGSGLRGAKKVAQSMILVCGREVKRLDEGGLRSLSYGPRFAEPRLNSLNCVSAQPL